MTLTILIIAQSIRTVYINLLPIQIANQAKRKFATDTATSTLPMRNAVTSSSLVAFLNYLNHTNARRARYVPEQTYPLYQFEKEYVAVFLRTN